MLPLSINMEKITIIFIAFIFFVGSFLTLGFAQEPAPPIHKVVPTTAETKSLRGKVISVSLADAVKGTRSEIVVTGKNGQRYIFLVKSTTTIYDANWKPINLDKIVKDQRVIVKYTTTKEGVLEAKSIKIKA